MLHTVTSFCQVVDELLAHGADATQALTHGLNNALCVATSPLTEINRSLPARVALVCIIYCHLVLFPLLLKLTLTLDNYSTAVVRRNRLDYCHSGI